MIEARCSGVKGVPVEWEIANILVVGTAGVAVCANAGVAKAAAAKRTDARRRMKSPGWG